MPEDKAVDQAEATTTEEVTAENTQAVTETTDVATDADNKQTTQQADQKSPESEPDFIGEIPKELEPFKQDILKKFYAKTRELATERHTVEKVKKDAETLQQLMAYKPFQDWYKAQQNGGANTTEPEKANTLTEEELDAIRTDPSKLDSFLTKKLESLVESKYGNQMKSFQEKAEDAAIEKEFSNVEATYGDEFRIAHESGDLDAYYDKGLDFETAFATYKLKSSGKANHNTADVVKKSRESISEKPSSSANKLPNVRIVKPKNFDDAFDQVFKAIQKGEKIRLDK